MGEELPNLDTGRLVLRLPRTQYAPELLSYFSRNVEHFARARPLPSDMASEEDSWRLQAERNAEDFREGRAVNMFAFPHDGRRIVGNVSLSNVVRGAAQYCDLGYSLDRDWQGRGYATEMVRTTVKYAFKTLRLHRVRAAYRPENGRSGRLLRNLGFAVEGYARDYLLLGGHWEDHVLVGLINEHWRPPELLEHLLAGGD